MTTDPMANPGRRLTEARRRRQKLAVADLLSERFSRSSTAAWWPTPPAHTDAETIQYFRRLELETAAVDDETEEAPDGDRSQREDVSPRREARRDEPA